MEQLDIRPKSVKVLNKTLEAITGLSSLAVVAGMLDSVYTHYVNLEASAFIPLISTAIVSGLLSVQTSRSYWNGEKIESYEDFAKKLKEKKGWR
jgi:hypothetical protein